jgi:hypothetical protein
LIELWAPSALQVTMSWRSAAACQQIDALEHAQQIEVLVTRINFPDGQPNGVSLAPMTRVKKPGVKILFAALPEPQEHTEGIGEFLPAPVDPADIVARVGIDDRLGRRHAGSSSRTALTSSAACTGFDRNLSRASSARRLNMTGHSAAR